MPRSSKAFAALLLPALLLLLLSTISASQARDDCFTFNPSVGPVCGKFLQYWQQQGGAAQFGTPFLGLAVENSETDGLPYLTQYFESAVFEYHPQNKAPYDVQLALIGSLYYKAVYPSGAAGQIPNRSANSIYYRQTGHRLGGIFRQYWDAHGGLPRYGYPISDEFTGTDYYDGKPYVMQYFERAILEYQPENSAASQIVVPPLGLMYLYLKNGGDRATLAAPPTPTPTVEVGACTMPIKPGRWTGPMSSGLSLDSGTMSGSAHVTGTITLDVACDGSFSGMESITQLAAHAGAGSRSVSCTADGTPQLTFVGKVQPDGGGLTMALVVWSPGSGTITCTTPVGDQTLSAFQIATVPVTIKVRLVSPNQLVGSQWLNDGVSQVIADQIKLGTGYQGKFNYSIGWRLRQQ